MSAMSERTINPLLEITAPLFQLANLFRSEKKGTDIDLDYREKVLAAFDQFEHAGFEKQISSAKINPVKYALAAFVDEIVLTSKWPGKNDWRGKPLQLQFFGEHLAGEGFFKRLAELRQGGDQNVDVLEMYFVCLQLGFEGMYRLRGFEQLMALQVDLRSQIEMLRGVANNILAPHGKPKEGMVQTVGRNVPIWVMACVTATIIFFIYLGYSFAINHQSDKTLAKIEHLTTKLMPHH